MNPAFKRWLIIALLLVLVLGTTCGQAADAPPASSPNPGPEPSDAHAALQHQIEAILQRTHTPGAGVAIVRREGPEWIAGIGLADVANHRPVTPDTLFRIGSLSKSFVALSILKLQEEGKLNLQDTLKSRAPDLACENPWEQTDPVRLVHLLEHTSGWDDLGLRDLAFQPDREAPLREALAQRPAARHSRWKPGTRFAYSNVGSAAAAYVVEQVTGQRFEDYVEQNWFLPLRMTTASYWGTPEVQSRLTKLYFADGTTPLPYDKISLRPAGAVNASVRELANYVQFYLNRGAFGGVQLLPAAAIERMERATTSYSAREGLGGGYGLANYAMVQDGWVYHGHQGAVRGGLTELAYLPEAGVGYVVVTNSAHLDALRGIGSLIRHHLTGTQPAPTEPGDETVEQVGNDQAGNQRGEHIVEFNDHPQQQRDQDNQQQGLFIRQVGVEPLAQHAEHGQVALVTGRFFIRFRIGKRLEIVKALNRLYFRSFHKITDIAYYFCAGIVSTFRIAHQCAKRDSDKLFRNAAAQ